MAAIAAASAIAAAETPVETGTEPTLISRANLSGSLRASAWDIPKNPDGSRKPGIGEVWLKAAPHIGDATVVMEGWGRDTNFTHQGKKSGLLREGYVSYSAGDADFRIGKQIIVWGKADQLNPTDNLTPRDNTLYIPDIDDQRFGAMAARATYNFSGMALTGIWLPYFRPSKVPLPAMPGITFAETVPSGGEFALKLEQSGGAMDWSLSYFKGFDQNPDIGAGGLSPAGMVLSLQHHRIRVLGADAAATLGRFGFRAEAAYTWTEDNAGLDPFVKNPFFYGVVGADRTFYDNFNINLQYFVRQVANYSDPNAIADPVLRTVAIQQAVVSSQLDRRQQGISLRIADKWLNDTLEAEIAGVANFTRHDFMLRPRLAYAFDDHWKGTLGAYVYRGGANTFFGLLKDRSGGFAEARYSF
ncbi:MAG TPA: DUF1302 family protein [Gallionellaceae bacterium]